jgi:hypothetical protein
MNIRPASLCFALLTFAATSFMRHRLFVASIALVVLPCELWAADKPESFASKTVRQSTVDRARILSQVRWTPVAGTMPNRKGGFFEAGKENIGVPYSSVRSEGRYIGFDIG